MTSATVKDMLCIHSCLQISSDTSGCQIHYHSNHICTINFALLLLQAFVAVKTGSSFVFCFFTVTPQLQTRKEQKNASTRKTHSWQYFAGRLTIISWLHSDDAASGEWRRQEGEQYRESRHLSVSIETALLRSFCLTKTWLWGRDLNTDWQNQLGGSGGWGGEVSDWLICEVQ